MTTETNILVSGPLSMPRTPSRVSENTALPANLSQFSQKRAASASRTMSTRRARTAFDALAGLWVSVGSVMDSRQRARAGRMLAGSCMAPVRV